MLRLILTVPGAAIHVPYVQHVLNQLSQVMELTSASHACSTQTLQRQQQVGFVEFRILVCFDQMLQVAQTELAGWLNGRTLTEIIPRGDLN